MLNVEDAKQIQLELNKKYDLKQFVNCVDACYKLSLPNGIYGENKTRVKNKSIELNGIIIRNVENIIIECFDEMLWFVCLDANNNILASRGIKKNEELLVNETSVLTYEYNFKVVA